MSFPIKLISQGKVILKNGLVCSSYKPSFNDIDQFDAPQREAYLRGVESWLNRLKSGQWIRVLSLETGSQIISNEDQEIPGIGLKPCEDPLAYLLAGNSINQNPGFTGDFAYFNGLFYRFIKVFKLPDNVTPCFLRQFGETITNFRKLDPSRAKRMLNLNRRVHFSNLTKNIRDIESENTYSESEAILEEIINGNQSLFECETWILCRAESLDDLNEYTKEVSGSLELLDIGFVLENRRLAETFENELVFGRPKFKNSHFLNTCYLSELLPLTEEKINEKGIEFESRSGRDIYLNTNSQNAINNHGLITGASGSGKSFSLNKILFEELDTGAKAIIFDFEKSFLRTTKYFDGEVFDSTFNPMQFKDPKYLKAVLLSFIPKGEITQQFEGEIYLLTKNYLNDEDEHTFKGLINYISNYNVGFDYYFEEFIEHFDNKIRSPKDINFVDINLYPSKVLPSLILYMIETFKRLEGRRILILEECWNLLSTVSSFIEEFYRTFRKKNASVWAVSQGFEDFLSSSVGRVIIQNSNHKLFFSQNVQICDFLTDFDRSMIQSVKSQKGVYSEFYYKSNDARKILRYSATNLEYELFNTSFGDDHKLQKFIDEYSKVFSYRDCVNNFTRFEYV